MVFRYLPVSYTFWKVVIFNGFTFHAFRSTELLFSCVWCRHPRKIMSRFYYLFTHLCSRKIMQTNRIDVWTENIDFSWKRQFSTPKESLWVSVYNSQPLAYMRWITTPELANALSLIGFLIVLGQEKSISHELELHRMKLGNNAVSGSLIVKRFEHQYL